MQLDLGTVVTLIGTAFTSGAVTKAISAYTTKRKQDVALETTTTREDTARHRIAAKERGEQRDVLERQLDRKTNEHGDCMKRVDTLSKEVLDLSVNLARCEERHEAMEERVTRLERKSNAPNAIDHNDDEVSASMRAKGAK